MDLKNFRNNFEHNNEQFTELLPQNVQAIILLTRRLAHLLRLPQDAPMFTRICWLEFIVNYRMVFNTPKMHHSFKKLFAMKKKQITELNQEI